MLTIFMKFIILLKWIYDTAIQEELNNIIDGKIKEVLAFPLKDNNNYKYNFLHVQE